jgi:hypothetical protein
MQVSLVLMLHHLATGHYRRLELGEDAPWSGTVADVFGITQSC